MELIQHIMERQNTHIVIVMGVMVAMKVLYMAGAIEDEKVLQDDAHILDMLVPVQVHQQNVIHLKLKEKDELKSVAEFKTNKNLKAQNLIVMEIHQVLIEVVV